MRRREFLTSLAAAGLTTLPGCSVPAKVPLPPGDLLGTSLDLGHLLREPSLPPPSETRHVRVLIVGGGIGGLSAGWKLARAGFKTVVRLVVKTAARLKASSDMHGYRIIVFVVGMQDGANGSGRVTVSRCRGPAPAR